MLLRYRLAECAKSSRLKFDDVALLAFLDTHSVPLRFVNAKEKIFRECIGYRMHA